LIIETLGYYQNVKFIFYSEMTNIKIQKIKKKDYKTMLDIYIRAYLSV